MAENIKFEICEPCAPTKKYIYKCEHDKIKTYCKECGGSGYCQHDKRKAYCVDCNGSQICEHKHIRYSCKECKGQGLCEHNIIKTRCKNCKGSQICEHNRIRSKCVDCKGSGTCEHNRIREQCKDCGGKSMCIHKIRRAVCKECGGTQFCPHDKIKSRCKDCNTKLICPHNMRRENCKDCGGSKTCEHKKQKRYCRECKGSAICEHNIVKQYCKTCGGSSLCKVPMCETIKNKNKKYEGYCVRCFIHLFPDKPTTRNYKTKEKHVADIIKESFPNFTWIQDKIIQDGCSKRRPDFLLDMGTHIIIVEVDENKHSTYECICENKRLMEISKDLNHRPIVFIRFNPDGYIDENNNAIKSCWYSDKNGIMKIIKSKQKEWNERCNILKENIKYWIDNNTDKTIEIIELFY